MTTRKPKTRPYKKFFCDRPEAFLLPPIAFKIWMYHYSREGPNRESWPSIETIMKACGITRKATFLPARKYLVKNGWLDLVRKIPSRKGGQPVPVFKVRRGTIPCPCKGDETVPLKRLKGDEIVPLQGYAKRPLKGTKSVPRSRYMEVDSLKVDTPKPEVDGIGLSVSNPTGHRNRFYGSTRFTSGLTSGGNHSEGAMTDFVCDEHGGLLGEVVDGQFVPLPPAPTGEALDDLIDDICEKIEYHPRCGQHTGKMHSELKSAHGRYSLMLMYGLWPWQTGFLAEDIPEIGKSRFGGGVHAWITQGSLREASLINKILTDYADAKDTQVRRRKINDWTFDKKSLWEIGTKFGLQLPPLPTPEQIAERERVKAEEARKSAEDKARHNQMMEEVDRDLRKKKLLNTLADKFYTLDYLTDADCAGENMPQEFHDTTKWRRVFKKFNKDLVDSFVDAGLSDEEVLTQMVDTYTADLVHGSFRATVTDDLKSGELRHYVWPKDLRAFMSTPEYAINIEKYDSDIRLLADGRFAITFMPKGEL